MCAQLAETFCPLSPKARRSTALEIIKRATTVPGYFRLTPEHPKFLVVPLTKRCVLSLTYTCSIAPLRQTTTEYLQIRSG